MPPILINTNDFREKARSLFVKLNNHIVVNEVTLPPQFTLLNSLAGSPIFNTLEDFKVLLMVHAWIIEMLEDYDPRNSVSHSYRGAYLELYKMVTPSQT